MQSQSETHSDSAACSQTLAPLKSKTKIGRAVEIGSRLLLFLARSYKRHWIASPAGVLAAIVSSVGAASVMILISPLVHSALSRPYAIAGNAVIAPLMAYAVYLSVYYYAMFLSEHKTLRTTDGTIDREKLSSWFRVVKYDYLAHVPSDIYLISSAAIMQAALEANGSTIFFAVLISQFLDDLITFLKEPALWGGAKEIVAWENNTNTTLTKRIFGKGQE